MCVDDVLVVARGWNVDRKPRVLGQGLMPVVEVSDCVFGTRRCYYSWEWAEILAGGRSMLSGRSLHRARSGTLVWFVVGERRYCLG